MLRWRKLSWLLNRSFLLAVRCNGGQVAGLLTDRHAGRISMRRFVGFTGLSDARGAGDSVAAAFERATSRAGSGQQCVVPQLEPLGLRQTEELLQCRLRCVAR